MDVLGWDGNTLQAQAATLQRVLIFRGTQPCGDPVTPKRAHGCRLDVPAAEKPRKSRRPPGGHRGRAAERGDAEAREPWRGKGRGVARCLPEVTMGNKRSPLAKVHSYGTQDGELAGSADVHQQWQALGRGLQGLSLGEHVAADRAH